MLLSTFKNSHYLLHQEISLLDLLYYHPHISEFKMKVQGIKLEKMTSAQCQSHLLAAWLQNVFIKLLIE